MTREQFIQALAHFRGTEQYYEHKTFFITMYLTDGAHFVREAGKARWLMDLIASYQPQLKDQELQHWTLKYLGENKGWEAVCTDGNSRTPLVRQEIPYSDFIIEEINFYVIDNVILLTQEY